LRSIQISIMSVWEDPDNHAATIRFMWVLTPHCPNYRAIALKTNPKQIKKRA